MADKERLVIKIGSSSLVKEDLSINEPFFVRMMSTIRKLKDKGFDILIVSSGAIASGMHELSLIKKPKDMALKQACASIGQAKLMEYYNKFSSIYGLKTGQILVNHDDFKERERMLHLSNTLNALLKIGCIPIVNENDALSVDEIKVGDNDTLSALIAPMVKGDYLILFSDIDGLYDKNPKVYGDARLIREVENVSDVMSYANDSNSEVGTGGMVTKLKAAEIATRSGCDMFIASSDNIELIEDIISLKKGTRFNKSDNALSSRESWILFKADSKGSITIDDGLVLKLIEKKVSILPIGIKEVSGSFNIGDVIDIKKPDGALIAKGITSYSSDMIERVKGKKTSSIKNDFLYKKEEVIHANDMAILKR